MSSPIKMRQHTKSTHLKGFNVTYGLENVTFLLFIAKNFIVSFIH